MSNWLRHILEIHFDPMWGAPFWLERQSTLGFEPLRDVHEVDDLLRFGPFPLDVLATQPIEHFIPRCFHDILPKFITCETGGSTGPAARTAFRDDEFHAAFVEPFLQAAEIANFPKDRHWLFIGPSGPHPIGKAACACAKAMGSIDPFMVDFDPRWVRRLEGFAQNRYREHVIDQACAILSSQHIGVLFATPPVLQTLGERLDVRIRESIAGIHLGGMAGDDEFWHRLENEWFPNACLLSGYGNSLGGVSPELGHVSGEPPRYYPHGNRLVFQVDALGASPRGRVRFHRLDESCFLPNVIERDEATLVPAPVSGVQMGFRNAGLLNPGPIKNVPVQQGLY